MIYFRKSKKVVAVAVQFVGDLRECAAKLKSVSIPTALAMTGLMLLFGDVGEAAADVPIGPGPTNYTEQPQPPPGTCHYRSAANGETLPDPNCTPGTLDTTICKTGYTKSIRPPASITAAEKRANAASYGYSGPMSDIEYDHLVPLELGGDPNDPRNLWVEPGESPNPKDGVESRLHELVCEGTVPLAAAQEAIAVLAFFVLEMLVRLRDVRWRLHALRAPPMGTPLTWSSSPFHCCRCWASMRRCVAAEAGQAGSDGAPAPPRQLPAGRQARGGCSNALTFDVNNYDRVVEARIDGVGNPARARVHVITTASARTGSLRLWDMPTICEKTSVPSSSNSSTVSRAPVDGLAAEGSGRAELGRIQCAPAAGVVGAMNNVGSARMTPGGTSPIRVTTMGVLNTMPWLPHSLVIGVPVETPRSVPSACGCNE